MTDYFRKQTQGKRADLSNLGSNPRQADHIVAAALLEQFAQEIPYTHLDIAGPAMLGAPYRYLPADGTGFGVRLLVDYLRTRTGRAR